MNYRPYQRQCINNIKTDWQQHRSVMITAATGAGKTVIFLGLIDEIIADQPNARFLLIAHRTELIEQPIERMEKFWPHLVERAGIVMAGNNDVDKQIVVATIQTLNAIGRLDAILAAHGPFDYIITDECHHSVSDTYLSVYERLGGANPEVRHLGVTATPMRSDGEGLRKVYEKESAHYGIKKLVQMGHLAPPRWLAIQTGISLAGVPRTGSGENRDYSAKKLRSVFETSNCFDLVVESHKKYAQDRLAICFTATVDGAYELAEAFNDAGISAAAADGTTPKDERAQILDDFRSGKISVLVNVALWIEGLDLPEISCVHMVRPTQSDSFYMQAMGRGLRILPGKGDALVLDYAPVETRNIVMLGDVLGVDASKDAYIDDSAEAGEVAAGFLFDGNVQWMEGDPMEIISRQIDYLNMSPWKWTRPNKKSWMILGLGKGDDEIDRTLAISPPGRKMELWAVWRNPSDRWNKAAKMADGEFEDLSEKGEELAQRHGVGVLTQKQARWRKESPSEGQVKFAKRLGIYDTTMSKGAMAEAITYKLAVDALRRNGATVL